MTENGEFERGRDGRSTDIETGGGTPDWLASHLNYCSRCGSRLRFGVIDGEHRERLVCDTCGHIVYVNPRIVVTAFPVTGDGDLVLLRRGIEPGYGTWAQPGGFLEVDETVNQGAIRETLEETGLLIEPGEIIGLYTRLEAAVVTIAFEARIVGGAPTVTAEALEVRRSRRPTSRGTESPSTRPSGRSGIGSPSVIRSSPPPKRCTRPSDRPGGGRLRLSPGR